MTSDSNLITEATKKTYAVALATARNGRLWNHPVRSRIMTPGEPMRRCSRSPVHGRRKRGKSELFRLTRVTSFDSIPDRFKRGGAVDCSSSKQNKREKKIGGEFRAASSPSVPVVCPVCNETDGTPCSAAVVAASGSTLETASGLPPLQHRKRLDCFSKTVPCIWLSAVMAV